MSSFKRLPRTVIPNLYKLQIDPDLVNFTFSGNVDILSEVKEPLNVIKLNCVDLVIKSAHIMQGGNMFPATWEYDLEAQTVDLGLEKELTIGEANIVLLFNGLISTKMAGFYRIKYTLKGETVYGASTQFEAIDARRALPCFDEPDFKANFQLSLYAQPGRTVLSNMEVVTTTVQHDGRVLHEFGTTPKMSTYLLAYVIGDFDYVEQQSEHGVRIRIYTPVDRSDEGLFALEVAAKSLSFYENFFDLQYPLPKLDLVSIPDFSSGAMENWGLVTFRETTILVNQKLSSARTKCIVTLVVAHELAHMWFGNLVTMGWWTDLWLNEGFATFMEYFCSNHCYPDYKFDTMFLITELMNSLVVDALHHTHPVQVAITDPRRIDEIFDDISYSKGSSVISMLFHLIGETKFRECLKSYLTRYAYKNTETNDLWNAFVTTGYDVEGIMNTFTLQPGYPVVKVSCESDENGCVMMVLQQNRFTSRESDSSLWNIPIGYSSENDSENVKYVVLNQRKSHFPLNDVLESNWIKVNAGVHGFFRVQYSTPLFLKLLESIDALPLNDKISLLDDTFALGLCGYIDMEMALKLADELKYDFNTYIWGVISQSINDVLRIVVGSSVEHRFRAYVHRMLMSGIYEYVGWEVKDNEDPKMSLLRSMVFGMMATYGGDEFHSKCQEIFPKIISNASIVDPNIVLAIYQSVMSHATLKELGDFLEYYDKIERSEAKTIIIQAIGCLKCPGAVPKIFDILTSGKIRSQDIMYLLRGLRTHQENSAEFWQHYKLNYDFFVKSVQTSCLCGSIKSVSYFFKTDQELADFNAFFADKSVGIERTVAQCGEEIGEHKLRIQRHLTSLDTYFN